MTENTVTPPYVPASPTSGAPPAPMPLPTTAAPPPDFIPPPQNLGPHQPTLYDPSALSPFVQFDPITGQITSQGYMHNDNFKDFSEGTYLKEYGRAEIHYVSLPEKVIKERAPIEFDNVPTSVSIGTPLTLTGIPTNTSVFLNGKPVGTVTDTCEFVPNEPGLYNLIFRPSNPRWLDTYLTITVTDIAA